ncbi:MAG: FAD:protein FMN transferase [Lysobacteraceae bacterium]
MSVPASRAAPEVVLDTLYGASMGTRWRVCLAADRRRDLHALHDAIQQVLDGVVAQMSHWEPDSDISRFNRAPAGSWQVLPEAFFHVLQTALAVAEASAGAYDPSIGPLVDLWGFGPRGSQSTPSMAAQDEVHQRVGWQRLQLDVDGRRALQPGGLALDLSAIAKGHAVDAVANLLRDRGIEAALVDVGGELCGFGRRPDGAAWSVQVSSDEDDEQLPPCIIELADRCVASSGDRWRHRDVDGRRLAHSLDPRTGQPLDDAPLVTVIAERCLLADAWSTALGVLGVSDGRALAEREGIAVRFVEQRADGPHEHRSSSFPSAA